MGYVYFVQLEKLMDKFHKVSLHYSEVSLHYLAMFCQPKTFFAALCQDRNKTIGVGTLNKVQLGTRIIIKCNWAPSLRYTELANTTTELES